jgi:hypothetical protein
MIDILTTIGIAIGLVAGLLCIALGLAGRRPADLTLGATVVLEIYLLVQVVVAAVAPASGNTPTGSALEFWVYLVTAVLIPPIAVFWALVERTSRWSTVILGVACLAVVVMVYRMHQIWFVQLA